MTNLQNYLFELCGENLPSGFESGVSSARDLLAQLVDTCTVDRAGNVIGFRKSGLPNVKKVLLDAHLDEIGLMVTKIDDNGFIHFTNLAGFSPVSLPAAAVVVKGSRPLSGVVATLPPHLLSKEDEKKPLPMNKLVIDIGYTAEKARSFVKVGDSIVLCQSCCDLLNDRVTGKALDNRAGVAVLLHVLQSLQKMPLPVDLYTVFSAGEEFSGFGARHAAWEIAPDEAIVVDVTHGTADNTPKDQSFPLGSGAVVGISPVLNGEVTAKLFSLAEKYDIPYEREAMSGRTGTNSDCIAATRNGVCTGMVSIPLRYMHSGCEIVDLKDMQACSRLISRYILHGGALKHE